MWKKLLFLRREALLPTLLFLLILGCSVQRVHSATYYWRGGSGDWSQATTHWSSVPAASPLPGQFYSTAPGTNDDVVFDANSGGGSSYTVSLTGVAKNARNITVTSPVSWTGGAIFQFYGDMSLSATVDFTGYTGDIYVFQLSSGATKNIQTGGNLFRSPITFQPNFSGNTIVTGQFKSTSSITVNLLNATDKVTFQTHKALNQGDFIIENGEVYFEQGFGIWLGAPRYFVKLNGKLFTKQNSEASGIYNSGFVNLNPNSAALTHSFTDVDIVTGVSAVASVLNINNCTVNISGIWRYGRNNTFSNYSLVSTGSTIKFTNGSTRFFPLNFNFNNVVVGGSGGEFRFSFENVGGLTAPTFGQLDMNRPTYFEYSTTSLAILLQPSISYFKIRPGVSLRYRATIGGAIQNEAISTCCKFICTTLDQMGTCEAPIVLDKMAFQFSSVISDHIRSKDIWASGGPHNAGASSIKLSGGNTGWTINDPSAAVPRTLVWVGPIPAVVSDSINYGVWHKSENWRDLAVDPLATGPGYLLGSPACPPTLIDSVIFRDESYVRAVDTINALYAKSINWEGDGVIYGNSHLEMNIYGALTFSSSMFNGFYGTYHFKNRQSYRCKIKTNDIPFQRGVIFDAANATGSWYIEDDFYALNPDLECSSSLGSQSVLISNGVIHTGNSLNPCLSATSSDWYVFGINGVGGQMVLYDSDIRIYGGAGINKVLDIVGTIITPVKSHIICEGLYGNSISQTLNFGSGKKYNQITLQRTSLTDPLIDPTHAVYLSNDTIVSITAQPFTKPHIISTTANAGLVRKMNLNTKLRTIFWISPATTSNLHSITVDSLFLVGDVDYRMNVRVRSYLNIAPGQYSYTASASNNVGIVLTGPTSSFSNSLFNSCLTGSTSYPSGANAVIVGDCSSKIKIENILITNQTGTAVNASYLNLINSSITGAGGNYSNSNTSGTITGWIGTTSIPRKLHWVDQTGVSSAKNWEDPNNWEQILPVYQAAPQCPPTRIDTAVFDDNSFSALNQQVKVNAAAEVGSIYWRNIDVNESPDFVASSSIPLNVFSSLEFHQNMTNAFMGIITFKGTPTVQFPQNHLTLNTIPFKNTIYFNGDSDNTEWLLNDSLSIDLYAPGVSTFAFMRGRFLANGKSINCNNSGIELFTNSQRYFNITNSRIYCRYGSFKVFNPSTANVLANNSTIYIQGGTFLGGGKIYNDVIVPSWSYAPTNFDITTGEEFRNILIGGTANVNIFSSSSATGMKAKKILKDNITFTFNTNLAEIDSMLLFGPNITTPAVTSQILSSNKYFKDFEVKEGTTLILGSGSVQWFQNKCDVDLIGTSFSQIQFYASSIGPGNQAYLRKDSATVCADYINMRDIWGVGNGNDAASSCSTYSHPSNPNVNTYCPSAHPYLVSSCDTITDAFSSCGQWEILEPYRGRAAFTAGDSANNQGNNSGWDYKPYPPVPSTVLTSGTTSICVGQSVTLTITGVGKLPFDLDYSDSEGNVYAHTITNASQLTSYNPTTFAFTFTETVTPPSSITYYAGSISIDRCFKNVSPPGVGSMAIIVNPYPQINNAVLTAEVCSGNAVTITPTTTVPATVNWTSGSYPGVSGHGTSGSGPITETMTTSNTASTAVIYTLTPTANGCTGTPVDFTVNVNPRPNVVPGATQNLDCNTPTAVVSASSSTAGVQFGWTGPGVVSGASTNAATVNSAGTYSVLVTNPATGCTSTSSVAVNYIADNIAPVITCPSNISVNTTASTCNASVAVPNPTINDNCGVTLLTWSMGGVTPGSSPATGINYVGTQTFNLGTTPVTYTIRDASNNQTTCSFNVTVIDNVNPVITCPSDMTAFTSTSSCSASVVTPNPTVSDNCTVSSLNWTITQGATTVASGSGNLGTRVFSLGTSTVTYTVTDGSGNTANCSYTVTVTDNVNPTITCPSNMTAFTSTSSCSANVATPNPTVSDNCTVSSLNWTITQGAIVVASGTGNLGTHAFNLGTSTVTYVVTDGSGNTSNCFYTVTVTDNVNPTITCPSNMTAFTSASSCSASVITPNPTISDNCTVASVNWSITQGALVVASGTGNAGTQVFNLGVSTVTYTVTDASGNSSNCSYTVTVTDNVNPVITCPANISANTSSTSCDASVSVPNLTFSDNCTVSSVTWIMSGATVGASPSSGINQVGTQTFNSGITTISYTVRDAANNLSTCSFTVTVTDATAPVAPVLPDVTGQCAAIVPVPVATDNCNGFVFGTTPDPLTYNTQDTFVVHWTFTDAAGNITTANQTVIINNSLPPTPPILPTLFGECFVTADTVYAPTGCSGLVAGTTSDPLYYDQQGTYTITWTFDDGMGNVVTAPQTVIVDDTTAAVPDPIPNVLAECSATLPVPTATDNCEGTIYGTTTFPTTYSSQGTYVLTWTFDDGNGNTTNVNQTVTIADITDPVFSACPSNIVQTNDAGECGAIVNWTPPVASDSCSGFTVTSSHNPGDNFPLGTTTVTYVVTDVAGHTDSCSFDVTISDVEAPVIISCPSSMTVSNTPDNCGAIVNWTLPVASDNCPGVILSADHNPGDMFPLGTTTVTYTATDAAGNSVTCTFDITVNDTQDPVFTGCPSDITQNNDPGVCGAAVSWTPPTASDNCSSVNMTGDHNPGDIFPTGTTTVTYIGTDAAGNSVTCSFDVTVNDVEAPVISGLGDVSVCEGNVPTWAEVVTDNCPGVTYTSDYASGATFPLGNTTVTYTATDASGNQTTVSFVVNVYASGSVTVTASPSTTFCVGDQVNLEVVTGSSAGVTYSWIFNNTQIGTGSNYQFVSSDISQSGLYSVEVTLPGGCLAYGSATVTIDYCELLIPEAVTPNGDGMNDTWYIENLESYPNSTVQIVNRWGAVVFESDDYKNDWDGTSQNGMNIGGDELPEGTFYYVLRIGGDEASKFYHKVYTGYIYLKRK
jgi:gliding motility-associated-like protein